MALYEDLGNGTVKITVRCECCGDLTENPEINGFALCDECAESSLINSPFAKMLGWVDCEGNLTADGRAAIVEYKRGADNDGF